MFKDTYDKNMTISQVHLRSRKLQAAAIVFHLLQMLILRLWLLIYAIYKLYTGGIMRYVVLAYLVYLYLDRNIHVQGGRTLNWFRYSKYYDLLIDYFPQTFIVLAELPRDKNYLFLHHPHGVWFFGMLQNHKIEKQTGIINHVITLDVNFFFPPLREYLLASGAISSSEKSIKYYLTKPEGGHSVSVIPGGAAEAALSKPGEYRLVLKRRRGFIRLALETGASLVPVFTFGEVDVLDTYIPQKGSFLWKLQEKFKNIIGPYPVIYKSSGKWPMFYMAMPRRIPLAVVVGKPIHVKKNENPTEAEINALHEVYIKHLIELFNSQKHKYIDNAKNIKLFIE